MLTETRKLRNDELHNNLHYSTNIIQDIKRKGYGIWKEVHSKHGIDNIRT
jgi:hypothetical protein